MRHRTSVAVALIAVTLAGPAHAQRPTTRSPRPAAGGRVPPTFAQQLVDRFLQAHKELSGLELALTTDGACRTIAASDPKDIGEKCDADEWGPIRTGTPDVDEPTKEDPVYDITQALHDAGGHLIGAVGMDLTPTKGEAKAEAAAHALSLLRVLEAQIVSREKLLERGVP
jgi:hypothetical protein